VSFGEVAVGTFDAPQVLELRLRQDFAATVVGVRIAGDGSFRLSEDRCSGAELPAGRAGGCALAIVFGPLREGVAQAGLEVRMTHTCTSTTYQPCSWDPQHGEGQAKNFTRVVLQGGQVAFNWTTLVTELRGLGTTAAPATT
jgi:hypothetical protein